MSKSAETQRRRVLLVVGAAAETEALLPERLDGELIEACSVSDPDLALAALERTPADAVLVEAQAGQPLPFAFLKAALERWPGLPVLLAADALDAGQVAEAVALGASDLLLRPLAERELELALRKSLIAAARSAAAPPPPRAESGMVFGHAPAMKAVRELVEQVAPAQSTLLVRGESGTGKELVARAVHRQSLRADRPFIKIDCTSLPENLIESELFGYEKGAFTGALSQKLGRVQLADTGTLFLDEIGDLALPLQAKLLRLLQDREFERLGGRHTLRVDVRVVAATHRDLETMVERGTFRQDLFYRLNVVPIWLPPLRARRADIPELAEHFCAEIARGLGKPGLRFDGGALRLLASQRWPGNVRQLQNFVERVVVMCRGATLTEADVRGELDRPVRFATETGTVGGDAAGGAGAPGEPVRASLADAGGAGLRLDEALRGAERQALLRALEHSGGNRSAAARLLGVCRATLYTKLAEHGLANEGTPPATPGG
ncbi:MAG TPA: sigma-54 dependent transcriptional regulator [Polyangiaceae bacterium]